MESSKRQNGPFPASRSVAAPAAPPASSTTPAAGPSSGIVLPGDGDLWSNILDSVKGSRSLPTGKCLILGAPRAGKSTLVDRLRSPTGEPSNLAAISTSGPLTDAAGVGTLDLGMSYEVIDVRDEGYDGDTLARLSLFQLSSPLPPYSSLLSLALARDSLILIVLDWERPWEFVRHLEAWCDLLDRLLNQGSQDPEWAKVEGKERLEAYIKSYVEPHAPGASASSTTFSSGAAYAALDVPLPQGSLTDNLGVGLVFVCTKAEQMTSLEREHEFSEEQFDYVQQILRTIALRYGAAVFYTAQTSPPSFAKLRQYILHRLFSTPSLSPLSASHAAAPPTLSQSARPAATSNSVSASAPAPPTGLTSFAFPYRANVVDREAVLVPAGWDSWGKIRILRERFDCEAVGRGWELDLESWNHRRRPTSTAVAEEGPTRSAGAEEGRGLAREYGMVVVDFEAEDPKVNLAPAVSAADEQAFLREHYNVLQADTAADPRLAFRAPLAGSAGGPSSGGGIALGPSVVGPMAGTSLDLPTVLSTMERARARGEATGDEDTGAGAGSRRTAASREERYRSGTGAMSRQSSSTSAGMRSPPLGRSADAPPHPNGSSGLSPTLPSSGATFPERAASRAASTTAAPVLGAPTVAGGPGATPSSSSAAGAAAGGNQVLADFFQSLLTARTAGTGSAAGTGGTGGAAGAGAAGATGGAAGIRANSSSSNARSAAGSPGG